MNNSHTAPLYARLTATLSRPLVLLAALIISVPAEVQLARASGFTGGFEFLMPLTLSAYSAASAIIAANRPRGSKGRVSAIVGSGVALGMALSAQVVGHLISSGYMTSGPVLVSLVSSVPALAACHMLHLASMPRENAVEDDKGTPETGTPGEPEDVQGVRSTQAPGDNAIAAPSVSYESVTRKKGATPKATLVAIRDAAQNLDATGRKVNAEALADWFGVSKRTGHRYMSQLMAA